MENTNNSNKGKCKIITISRQFGSGGHEIGVELSKRLGIPLYDETLLEQVSEKSGYDLDFIEAMDNAETPARRFPASLFVGRDSEGKSYQDRIFDAECEVVKNLVKEGPFIIVGRCADYILKDEENCLKTFVYADEAHRLARVLERHGETEVPIEERVEERDKRRGARYLYHTGRHWGDKENYDICLSTSSLGMETCIDIIEKLARL